MSPGARRWIVGLMRIKHLDVPRLQRENARLRAEAEQYRRAFCRASDAGTSAIEDCDCEHCEETRRQMREYWLADAIR